MTLTFDIQSRELRTERQSARISKINNIALDQYGAEPFEQQQFGVEGVKLTTRDLYVHVNVESVWTVNISLTLIVDIYPCRPDGYAPAHRTAQRTRTLHGIPTAKP